MTTLKHIAPITAVLVLSFGSGGYGAPVVPFELAPQSVVTSGQVAAQSDTSKEQLPVLRFAGGGC